MKKNKNKKENLKICVHIPLYLDNSKNPAGLFGTFKVNQIISKNLKRFTPQSFFDKLIKKIKYEIYYCSRINLKTILKKIKSN